MASIGGRDCLSVVTNLAKPHPTLARYLAPAEDGALYRQQGKRPKPAILLSILDLADAAACQTEFEAYQALVGGDPVEVVDSLGRTFADVQVLDVDLMQLDDEHMGLLPVETPVGGLNGGECLLYCVWAVESTDLGDEEE